MMMASASTGTHIETERKFDAPAESVELDALPDLPGLADLLEHGDGSEEVQELDAVYYDTADLRLARAGVTLRRREGGSDEGWHLKLPVAGDTREEIRVPLARSSDRPPVELEKLTRVHTRGVALMPTARLVTRRRVWRLAGPEGGQLGELAEDHVHATLLGAASGTTSWREIEVELAEDSAPGASQLLDDIERRLGAAGARRSDASSKLNRALGDRLPASAEPDSATRATAGQAVMQYVRGQVEKLRSFDPLVRIDAPDSVHQMRVACRRMRSVLRGFGRVLDRDATADLAAELKWLGAELAGARDAEVMADRFATMLSELPAADVLGPVQSMLTRHFARRQSDARAQAIVALDSDRYLVLQDRLDALLAVPPFTGRAGASARRELARNVGKAYRRTARRMHHAETLSAGAERDAALHETRKAAKRLRYATEVAEPAVGKPAARLRKKVKAVQTILGDHQDTVVARPVLRELGAAAHLDGGNGFTFGVLYAVEQARACRLEQELGPAWDRLDRRKNTAWTGG